MAQRAGRRPGKPVTREAILAAAAQAFGERGFDGATVRGIAADAGVDPALISHYFGSKEGLFIECVHAPLDPRAIVNDALAGPPEQVAQRLVGSLLTFMDSPAGVGGIALLRTALQHERNARMLREFLTVRALRPLSERLSPDPAQAPWRASLAASQVAGLLVSRYILKIEPLASAPPAQVIAAIGPTLERYLTGPLGEGEGEGFSD